MFRTPIVSGEPRQASSARGYHQPRQRSRSRLLLATVTTALSLAVSTLTAPSAQASYPIILGASGDADELQKQVGVPLARHYFGQLNGRVPAGRLVNMKPNVTWSRVATAPRGSVVYADIIRWADTINARPGRVLFTFSHEPEGASSDWLGSNTEFIAAFKRVQTIFRNRGVDNVEYTWNVTSNAFRVPSTDNRYAPKWYPGDAYVDNVATAGYNWYNCGEGKGNWESLESRASAPLAFAKRHGKPYVLAEFASQRDPRRAQWIRDAHAWLKANRAYIRGAFYYNRSDARPGCYWRLMTDAEISAFTAMAGDPAFGS